MTIEIANNLEEHYKTLGYSDTEAYEIVKGLFFWMLTTNHHIAEDEKEQE